MTMNNDRDFDEKLAREQARPAPTLEELGEAEAPGLLPNGTLNVVEPGSPRQQPRIIPPAATRVIEG